MPVQRSSRGFILVEVLVSVAILSVSVTLIIRSMSAALRNIVYSTQYTRASDEFENYLFAVLSKGGIEPGHEEHWIMSNKEPKTKYTISALPRNSDENDRICRVQAETAWVSGRRNNKITIETYLLKNLDEHGQ